MALFHVFSEVENRYTGVPMAGVQVRARFSGVSSVAPIYADPQGTPFVPANYCVSDNDGMYSFYVDSGTYDLDFLVGGQVVKTIPNYRPAEVGPTGPANSTYTTTNALENADVANVSGILSESGKAGTFTIRNYVDFTAEVTADTGKVNYIRSISDPTKVWVRTSILSVGAAQTGAASGLTVDAELAAKATLTGVARTATNLGTFTGSTIPDNVAIKSALQAVETAVENTTGNAATKANATAIGVAATDANMGTFTGSIIPDNQTAKQGMQALETSVESKLPISDPVSNGISRNKAGSWPDPENSVSMNATFTNGSANITVTNGAVVNNGDTIRGAPTQLPYQTYVVSGGGTNNLVLSRPASAAGTVPVTFGMDRWDLTSTTVGDTAGYRRLYIGAAAQGRSTLMAKINGQGLDYEQVTAFSAENELGAVGGWFGSRMSLENTGLAGLISLGTYCLIDEDPVSRHAWNGYDQSNLLAGTAPTGTAQFIQRECSLESYWPVVTTDPFNYNPAGSTRIFRLDPGIGDYAGRGDPLPNNISHYIDFVDNGAKALKGLIFGFDSLVNGGQAIAMASGAASHAISWYSGAGAEAFKIFSTATTGNMYLWNANGLLTLGEADFSVTKNSGSAQKVVSFRTANLDNWTVGGTATAQSGGNAGTDFAIARFSDAGTFLAVPFSIRRSNGRITLEDLAASTAYADRTAAQAAGLGTGDIYRSSDGTVKVV